MIAGKEGPFIHIATIIAEQLITRVALFSSINKVKIKEKRKKARSTEKN